MNHRHVLRSRGQKVVAILQRLRADMHPPFLKFERQKWRDERNSTAHGKSIPHAKNLVIPQKGACHPEEGESPPRDRTRASTSTAVVESIRTACTDPDETRNSKLETLLLPMRSGKLLRIKRPRIQLHVRLNIRVVLRK